MLLEFLDICTCQYVKMSSFCESDDLYAVNKAYRSVLGTFTNTAADVNLCGLKKITHRQTQNMFHLYAEETWP